MFYWETIILTYKKAIVAPGEMVGMIAAQSIGEPTTQMSCPYHEKIKIIRKNKKTNDSEHITTEIGKFIDNIIKNNEKYTFNTGHVNSVETLLEKCEDEYFIIGVDKNEKTSWNKISHVSRHPVNGNIIKITTRSGRVVESTLSHSHLTRKEHSVQPINGSDLKIGMRIPVLKSITTPFIKNTINIDDKEYSLTKLFGWFIGAYLSEGNINGNEIFISNISQTFIDNTIAFSNIINSPYTIIKKMGEYGPSVTTKIKNKSFTNFIKLTCNNGSYNKKIPDFAFNAPDEFKSGLLQGYFDGDGNIQSDINHHQIRVCSRSKQLIKDISILLTHFGIFSSIKENIVKEKPMYLLNILSKFAYIYKEKIGTSLHSKKLDSLIEYLSRDNVHNLSDTIDKIEGLGDIIALCGKELKLKGHSRNYGRWKKKNAIGRRTLKKYIDIFNENIKLKNNISLKPYIDILEQACYSNIVWDEIISIEEYTPSQNNYVYDFTVPSNQTFMNDYGVIVHNTLNTFHFAGVASKSNVTRGVPRIEEILSLSENPKNPSCTVFLKEEDETNQETAQELMTRMEHTKLREVIDSIQICFDPDDLDTLIEEDRSTLEQYKEFQNMVEDCIEKDEEEKEKEEPKRSKWIIRMVLNAEEMLDKNITMDDIHFALKNAYKDLVSCVFSDYNSDKLIFRIRLGEIKKKLNDNKSTLLTGLNPLDQSNEIYVLKTFQDNLLDNIILRGVKHIDRVMIRKITDNVEEKQSGFEKKTIWVLDTVGTNLLDILGLNYVDINRSVTNDIQEVYRTLGIEAARQSIFNEISEVIEFDGTYINYHHVSMLCDRMTCNKKMTSIFRHGINNDNIGPIAKASFEETPEMFLRAARHGELDEMRGVSSNVMCGQEGYFGTSAFKVVLDIEEMMKHNAKKEWEEKDINKEIEEGFGEIEDSGDACSTNNIAIDNNIGNIKKEDLGSDDDDYDMGF